MHPNERLLRQEYEARASSDDAVLADAFTDDVVWHVPGRSAISGDYRGKEQVMTYVRRRREIAQGTFKISVEGVLANDENGLVIARGSAVLGGKTREWRAHGLYRFQAGQIAECWVLPEDQYLFDEIWA
jgi:ketosteroid isomerase-like protein